jgi:uncharacterized protein
MKFVLKDLPESREIVLSAGFLRDALVAVPGQAALADEDLGEVKVTVELTIEMQTVFARGQIRGTTKVACSRCLGPVALPIRDDVLLTFLPHDDHAEGEELELTEDDLDVTSYEGNEIDLAPILRDQIVLSVPYAPLCQEDCKGLCPQCGAELNLGPCSCPAPDTDSRWAALKRLKLDPSK